MERESGSDRLPGRRLALAWAVIGFLALGFAWEQIAQGYAEVEGGLVRRGAVFLGAGRDLERTRAELPPAEAPRIALFGSSQIATVKGGGAPLPETLHEALARLGRSSEVVDYSDGGQQTVESMVIWLATAEDVGPDLVVIGVSLFSMLSLDVRATLLADLDPDALARRIRGLAPPDASPEALRRLASFARAPAERVASRGETLQQRIDRTLGARLTGRLAAVANRQTLFDELLDRPLRRDLRAWLTRNFRATRTARSYEPNAVYPTSLLALETMQGLCAERGIPLLVVVLPFDSSRPPVPFQPAVMARIRADLDAAAARSGFAWTDLSDALASGFFGDFTDGSPDNLHFDAGGHARLGARLAPEVLRRLPGTGAP